jgi:hypothetical protein
VTTAGPASAAFWNPTVTWQGRAACGGFTSLVGGGTPATWVYFVAPAGNTGFSSHPDSTGHYTKVFYNVPGGTSWTVTAKWGNASKTCQHTFSGSSGVHRGGGSNTFTVNLLG